MGISIESNYSSDWDRYRAQCEEVVNLARNIVYLATQKVIRPDDPLSHQNIQDLGPFPDPGVARKAAPVFSFDL